MAISESKVPFIVRPANQDDLPLINTDFIKGYSHNPQVGLCPKDMYLQYMRQHIQMLLSISAVLMAVHPDDPTATYGWLMGAQKQNLTVIHWAHTKSLFHRQGIQKALLNALQSNVKAVAITHYFSGDKQHPSIKQILQSHPNFLFIPFDFQPQLFTTNLI